MNPDEAAAETVDDDRLLDGEDPATPYADDAEHWVRVYAELLDYKKQVMDISREAIEEMDRRAAREIQVTDMQVIATEAERFGRRLEFWRRRMEELSKPA